MRLEVRYPDGVPHEVELQGTLVVLGRDPSCDLVLNDVKCSRRHAVIEAGPDGLVLRDTGSANGVFLNGQKVERSKLKEGDLVRLGDVSLVVLPDEVAGTVIMGPEEVTDVDATARPFPAPKARTVAPVPPDRTIVPAPPGPPGPEASPVDAAEKTTPGTTPLVPAAPTVPAGPSRRRQAGVITLAVLWLLSAPSYAGLGLAAAAASHGAARGLVAAGAMLLAIVCLVIAIGLWTLKPWARVVQIVAAVFGLLLCPFTLASAVALVYALRGSTRRAFSASETDAAAPSNEPLFAIGLVVSVMLGVVLAIVLAIAIPSLLRAREAARGGEVAVFIDGTAPTAV